MGIAADCFLSMVILSASYFLIIKTSRPFTGFHWLHFNVIFVTWQIAVGTY